jgi:hypothetical protein
VAVALSLGVLQLVVAGAMIVGHLPPVLRSLHEATGVSIWIATFTLAYLARIASGSAATLGVPDGDDIEPDAGRTARGAHRLAPDTARIAPSASRP